MTNNQQPGSGNKPAVINNPPSTPTARRPAWAQHPLSKRNLEVLGIWLALRLGTSLWAAIVSPLRPLTQIEQSLAIWPPSLPIGAWLERVWLAPWERWDVKYYIWIVTRGYQVGDGTTQFHPLFPWLAMPLTWAGLPPLVGLLVISSLASLLLLFTFENMAQLDLDSTMARTSVLLLIFSPLAFILLAPYTESLFLLMAVLCLYWSRQQRWWLAGAAGALATLTRQQGLFLAIPLAWEMWQASGQNWQRTLQCARDWAAIGLVPAGMLIWLVYRAVALADFRVDLSNAHTLIFSLLISPSADKVVPIQTFMWPWQAIGMALGNLAQKPEPDIIVNLTLGAGFMALLIAAWPGMRTSYRLYTIAITLVSFSYHTGPVHPYQGLPRHLLLAAPVFVGLAPAFRNSATRLLMAASGLLGMLFLLLLYVMQAWIP